MATIGLGAFTWLTLVNVGLGLWYYLAQPPAVRKLFMGGSALATTLFAVGFGVAVVMVIAGFLGRRRGPGGALVPLLALTLAQMITMIMMRDVVRGGHLGDHFQTASYAVQPQVMNLVIFAVLLLGGIAVVAWMLRQLCVVWDR